MFKWNHKDEGESSYYSAPNLSQFFLRKQELPAYAVISSDKGALLGLHSPSDKQ